MKEYLKMSDAFVGNVYSPPMSCGEVYCDEVKLGKLKDRDTAIAFVRAINSHDELVDEVERLREAMSGLLSLTEHFAECGGWDVNAYAEYKKAKGA